MSCRLAVILAAMAFTSACRRSEPPLIAAVPPGTTALMGLDLTAILQSPLYPKLPPAVGALIEPVRRASTMLIAWNGTGLLLLARGRFEQHPPGYVRIGNSTAAAGASDRIQAARTQLESGQTGAGELTRLVPAAPIWAVIRGDGQLPLTGNLANAKNLLREADYTIVSAQPGESINLSVTSECPTPDNARRLEQSLRALATLAAAANTRQPDLAALLRSVNVSRDDRVVRVTANGPAATLLRVF
jgi:hypothetical protein